MGLHSLLSLLVVVSGCSLLGGDDPEDIDLDLDFVPADQVAREPLLLFAVHSSSVLAPLACTAPDWPTPRSGSDCLELLPDDPRIDVGEGKLVGVLGRTTVQCLSGRSKVGLETDGQVRAWPVVTWSTGAVPWCSLDKAAPGETLEPALEGALQRTAATLDLGLAPPAPEDITIEPIYRVDLDGDGQQDHIARAIWPDLVIEGVPEGEEPPPPPPPAQQELLVLLGGYQAVRFDMPLPQLVELTGSVDLDGDGRCELVVAAERDDGSSVALARWAGQKVELVTAYECGI